MPLQDAITQWANVGGLIHSLHTSNYQLLKSSLHDVIIEPYRSKLIPSFDEVKSEALKTGALGCGISGSGPSIFALCEGLKTAKKVESAMQNVYKQTDIEFETYVSEINIEGIKILKQL